MRRYFSVAGGLAWRLLHSLVTNPLLFLPPMLMPLFFFTAFAGGLSAVSNVPGFDYGPGYTSFIFAFAIGIGIVSFWAAGRALGSRMART